MNLFSHLHHPQQQQRAPAPPPRPQAGPAVAQCMLQPNIFTPLPDEPPPIASRPDHPVPRKGICIRNTPVHEVHQAPLIPRAPSQPLHTNKFYANFFLGEQSNSVWTQPYSLQWCRGGGNAQSWGLGISHVEREQIALGPTNEWGASQYFINPTGIHSVILSAKELGGATQLTTDELRGFSCNVNFAPQMGAPQIVSFPLLQGMGFVTGIYRNCVALVQSSVFFREFSAMPQINGGQTSKYRMVLEDGKYSSHNSKLLFSNLSYRSNVASLCNARGWQSAMASLRED
jgi:endo-1,3(4)-beta-glucanase